VALKDPTLKTTITRQRSFRQQACGSRAGILQGQQAGIELLARAARTRAALLMPPGAQRRDLEAEAQGRLGFGQS